MGKQKCIKGFAVWLCIVLVLLVCGLLSGSSAARHESIREVMKDAVLHESNKISLLGILDVNPALISAFTVTVIVLLIAACIRIFVIPKFQYIPGRFQLLLEQIAAVSGGLVKVENNEVLVLVDTAERPEDIDANRAKRAADEAKEAILQKRSIQEYHSAQANLARAINRIKVKNHQEAISPIRRE